MKWLPKTAAPRNGAVRPRPTPTGPCMTPQELAEFRSRLDILQEAWRRFQMLDESYRAWMRALGERYGVGTLFEVSAETGELTRKDRAPMEGQDGRPDATP